MTFFSSGRTARPNGRLGTASAGLPFLLVVSLIIVGCARPASDGAATRPSVTSVTTALPIERDVQDYEEFTGRLASQYSVEVRARVTGYLDKIAFQDGAEVKAGDPLFVIDPRPFKAANDSAVALIAVKKASSSYREAEFNRDKELVARNAASRSEFDRSAAAYEEAKALVTSAEAEAEITKLNLDFTEIRAPINGVVSDRKVDVGNLVIADQTLLTSIVSVDPLYVNFDVDERRLLRINQEVRSGKIRLVDDIRIPIELALDNETGFPHPGTIDFADNQIDANTGTIRLRAVVPNPLPQKGKRTLIAGMFARVRVPLGEPHPSVLIAEQAIGSDQGRKYVYVVDGSKKVQYRPIRVGRSSGGLVVVDEGLKPGEAIIVAGLQRVRPGAVVEATTVEMQSFASGGSAPPAEKPASPASTPAATPPATN
jgi:RND family efflux transporter MFP subunit